MALQAVSGISSVSTIAAARRAGPAFGAAAPALARVEAAANVRRRDDAGPETGAEDGDRAGTVRRNDESYGYGQLSTRELERRLVELQAEKARGERKDSDLANAKSLETARILDQLRSRDSHVRSHEAAHIGAGGRYVRGGAAFSYQTGPDGRQYAVGGEVGIDSSPVPGKPRETAEKMRVVRAAALAPSDPSAADLSIAAAAANAEAEALAELAAARMEAASKSYASERDRGAQPAPWTGREGAAQAGRIPGAAGTGLVAAVIEAGAGEVGAATFGTAPAAIPSTPPANYQPGGLVDLVA